jgi:hypothetical protein
VLVFKGFEKVYIELRFCNIMVKKVKFGKRFSNITLSLIILLSIRLIAQIYSVYVSRTDIVVMSILFVFLVLYALALLGVIKENKWGLILVMVIATTDLIIAFLMSGATALGAGIFDLALLILGYFGYKKLS